MNSYVYSSPELRSLIENSISILVKDDKDSKVPIEMIRIYGGDLRGFSISILPSFDIECKILTTSNNDHLTEKTILILQDNLSIDGFAPASCRDDFTLLDRKITALMDLWGLPSQLASFALGIKIQMHPNSAFDTQWIIYGKNFGDRSIYD